MFNFLKDKLKNTIKKISDSISDEGEEGEIEEFRKPTEEEVKKAKIESLKRAVEEKPEKKELPKKKEEKKTAPKTEEKKVKEPKQEKKPDVKEKIEVKEEPKLKEAETEVKQAPEPKEEKQEKKGFFSKLKDKFAKKEEKVEEEIEKIESKLPPVKGVHITYFVHGTTIDNEQHKSTGHLPGKLSELGIKQAKELKEHIKDKHFDVVISSDLKRAVESMELGFKHLGIPMLQDKRIRECDYGDLSGKPSDEVIYEDHINEPFPKGESLKDVERRIAEFLNYLYDNYKGKRVALMAHKSPQLAIEVLIEGKTWEKAIDTDWRKKKAWQPGWEYELKNKVNVPQTISKEQLKETEPEEMIEKAEEKVEEIKKHIKEKPAEEIRREIEEVKEEVKEAVKEEIVKEVVEEQAEGFLSKLKQKISTKKISESQFDEIFWELEVTLLENNVAVEVIEKIKSDLKEALVEKPIKRSQITDTIISSLKASISELFDVEKLELLKSIKTKKPYVICFVGVNGSGKTTTIAKVAHLMKKNNLKVVMAAADTFRAAAIQQLEEHANNLNIKMIKHDYGSDAAAVAFDAVKYAEAKDLDVVLIDTAGRLHSNANLMEELKKVIRVAKPDATIFLGEAITGNDCVEQAVKFNEAVGVDAIILAKADVDEKGGAAISVSYVTKKPILYLGTGQTYDDLEEFNSEKLMSSLGL